MRFPTGSLSFRAYRAAMLLIAAAWMLASCGKSPEPETPTAKRQPVVPPTYTIRGQATLADAGDSTGVTVFCAGTSLVAYTNAEGNFAISNIPPGSYTVAAQKTGYKTTNLGDLVLVPFADGAAPYTIALDAVVLEPDSSRLDIPAPVALGGVQGRVVLADGAAPDPVTVSAEGTGVSVVTSNGGQFRLTGLGAGNFRIAFQRTGYAPFSMSVDVRDGETTDLSTPVRLAPLGQGAQGVLGQVLFLDRKGRMVGSMDETVASIDDLDKSMTVDSEGKFLFDNIPAGTHTVSAASSGFRLRNAANITVKSGEMTNAVLVLDEEATGGETDDGTGSVTGRIVLDTDPPTDPIGSQAALSGTSRSTLSDRDGAFVLDRATPGTYKIICSREGFAAVEIEGIEVVEGETTDLGDIVMQPEVKAPRIVSTDPADGATGVPVELKIPVRLVFDKRMQEASVLGAISIRPQCAWEAHRAADAQNVAGDAIEIVIRANDQANPIVFHTRYTVVVGAGAMDVENATLEKEFQFSFETGGLRVLLTVPEKSAEDVTVNMRNPIRVYMNGVVNPDTVTRRSVNLTPSPIMRTLTSRVETNRETGWSVLTIPLVLQNDTKYTLTIGSSLQAADGSRFEDAPYRLRFRTEPNSMLEPKEHMLLGRQ
jgi:hypothetical protein